MKKLIILLMLTLLASIPMYAQKSFDMRYNEAVQYYTQHQYDNAIKVLEAAKKSPGVTKDQVSKATRFIKQCQASKQKMADLTLSKESVFFPGTGQSDSVYVTAGKGWEITSHPEWCAAWKDADIIYMKAQPNESKESRQGVIEVTMGKERTAYVLVTQDKRQNYSCPVRIHTVPGRAIIYVDSNPGMLTEDFTLGEGRHKVVIEKSGYVRKDTTLVVDSSNSAGMTCLVKLVPTFATLSVDIQPAEGYTFDTPAMLDISGNEVNLHPSIIKSFNVDQELSYYSLYEDNIIPLHPGQYIVKAFADGFKPETRNISVERGGILKADFVLEPICGTLSVKDEENAADALVFVDGAEVGSIPVTDLVLKRGRHVVKVEKPGLMSEKPQYEVDIEEDTSTDLKVSMQHYSVYKITSEPLYCKVFMDGKPAGTAPLDLVMFDGTHQLRFEKTGYFPQTQFITTDLKSPAHELSVELQKAFPLLVTADKDSLGISITQNGGKTIFARPSEDKTPTELYLPLSKKPYHIELIRADRKKAYRGNFMFNNPRRDHVNYLTWTDGPAVVSGQYYLVRPPEIDGWSPIKKPYYRIADVNLLRFKVLPGLSTSLAKGALFVQSDASSIYYPATSDGKLEMKEGDEGYKNVTLIPALSIVFLNGEFRIGGGIMQYCDVNLLASYAWYPNLSKVLTFTHMSGHDAFLGLELNSRIPVFNVSLRAGLQAYYGKANIARPNAIASGGIENRYVTVDYVVPVNAMQFVVGMAFSLGAGESRGQNILRVF